MDEQKIPLGSIRFNELVNGSYLFVDKTMFVKAIQESGSKSILITRPRRFGKSFALSMLDRFYNIRYLDEESEKDSFSGLDLSNDSKYAEYSSPNGPKNHYPVIKLDMSMIEKGDTASFRRRLIDLLKDMVNLEFGYLQNSDRLDGKAKSTIYRNDLGDEYEPGTIVKNLCHRLYMHHGVEPVLLIDEYDKPIENALDTDDFDGFVSFYGEFLRVALKSNPYKTRIVMSGIQRIVVQGIFSSLNDFEHIGLLSRSMNEFFGFTLEEVEWLASRRVSDLYPHLPDDQREHIVQDCVSMAKEWYDGYNIGGKEIFNPWSIMLFLKDYDADCPWPKGYWNDTSESSVITTLFSKADSEDLELIRSLYVSDKPIAVKTLSESSPLWKSGDDLCMEEMFSLLVYAGYLTVYRQDGMYILRIPNKEVRMNFDTLMERVYCIDIPRTIDLLKHMISKDPVKVKRDLEMLMESGSYLDGWKESRYKQWLSQLFAINGYLSTTERESGVGRTDIIVKGQGGKPSVVMEIKVLDPDDDPLMLESEAMKGLTQISDQGYVDNREMRGAIALSVAFWKKKCEVMFL